MNALAYQLTRSARATQGLHRIAEALAPSGNVKAKVRAAHAQTGLPYSRTRELWYGRARRIEDVELSAIEAALPPDTVEFSLAYVRSVEGRVAALLEELVAVRTRCEAELAARGDPGGPARSPDKRGGAAGSHGGGDALDRP